jgi:SAM-dependent methyltransferase
VTPDFHRLSPFSRVFGFDRGTPVDRRYIEDFLARHAADVRGRVLEVKDDAYTRRFGGAAVRASEVLDVDPGNRGATIVDDLTSGTRLPSDAFDCVLLTQTLQLLFDVRAAIGTVHRILKPGGVALVTAPGITQIPRAEAGSWYWSFTELAVRRLFEAGFAGGTVRVDVYGNVLAATAFLYGLATHELRDDELDTLDPEYPVIVAVRAVKAGARP